MGTTVEKIEYAINAKEDIKDAIEEKGVTVGNAPLGQYGNLVRQISGGGGIENYEVISVEDSLPIASAESPDFVQYNGKLYRKITTTVNKNTWIFHDNGIPSLSSVGQGSFEVDFTSNNMAFTGFSEANADIFYTNSGEKVMAVVSAGLWVANPLYKTIVVSGGGDATNPDFLAWLSASAEDASSRAYSYEIVIPLDSTPTENSTNGLTSGGAYVALSGKQNTLTFDQTPTLGSNNPATSNGIKIAIDTVDSIAKGAQQAISFTNYSTMVTAINALAETAYNVGQNIYIVTVDVPDLWVSSVESTSVTYTYTTDEAFTTALKTDGYVQVGYYKLSALETGKVDLSDYYNKTQTDGLLETKLTEPNSGLAVGKYFRIASIDSDGHAVLECVDPPTAPVQSISTDGTALTPDANGNVDIPTAVYPNYGVVRVRDLADHSSIKITKSGVLKGVIDVIPTDTAYVDLRFGWTVFTPAQIDYGVKAAMCDGVGAAWTTVEQSAARQRMGIISPVSESYTIATSDWSALSGSSPYTYSATVTATHTIGNDTEVELINDQAILFATYGFAIGSVSGQSVTIYSIGEPSASVILEVVYRG